MPLLVFSSMRDFYEERFDDEDLLVDYDDPKGSWLQSDRNTLLKFGDWVVSSYGISNARSGYDLGPWQINSAESVAHHAGKENVDSLHFLDAIYAWRSIVGPLTSHVRPGSPSIDRTVLVAISKDAGKCVLAMDPALFEKFNQEYPDLIVSLLSPEPKILETAKRRLQEQKTLLTGPRNSGQILAKLCDYWSKKSDGLLTTDAQVVELNGLLNSYTYNVLTRSINAAWQTYGARGSEEAFSMISRLAWIILREAWIPRLDDLTMTRGILRKRFKVDKHKNEKVLRLLVAADYMGVPISVLRSDVNGASSYSQWIELVRKRLNIEADKNLNDVQLFALQNHWQANKHTSRGMQ